MDHGARRAAAAPPAGAPARADGVTLIGELDHSGYETSPYLARRADGQTIQLTELLYVVLEAIDGQRDLDAIADVVSEQIGRRATAENIAFLVDEKLRPLGLLTMPDGSQPAVEKANPLLALQHRIVLSSERRTQALTAPFQPLFVPPVVLAVVVGFLVMTTWLLVREGLAQSTRELLYDPFMVLLTLVLTMLSAGFHEFGHAAACRYGGARPGVMGAGIYLVWPAFYTDVTDSYRLSRGGRLRTDLGGLYFNAIFALAMFGVWAATGYAPLLVLVPLQLLQMVHQLLPFVRLDGYYLLSDITGVPDLFSRIKPTLKSAVPGQEDDRRAAALKPWVRVVVTTWVLAVVPILLLSLLIAVISLPRLAATAADSFGQQWDAAGTALGDGDVLAAIVGGVSLLALLLPLASTVYLLVRLARRVVRGGWRWSDGRPAARVAVAVAAVAAVAGMAWLWWPNGEYEPIRQGERWTFQEGVDAVAEVRTGRPALTEERERELDEPAAENPAVGPADEGTSEPEATTSTTAVSDDEPSGTTSTTNADAPADEPTTTTEPGDEPATATTEATP